MMARKRHRGLSLLLTLLLVCSLLPVSALAEGKTVYTRDDVGSIAYSDSGEAAPEGTIPTHSHWERTAEADTQTYPNCDDPEHLHTESCGEAVVRYAWTLAENEWIHGVKVYLKYDNTPPATINAGDVAANYGPSGNNTPYFTVSIDMTMLEEQAGFNRTGGARWFFSVENPGALEANGAFTDNKAGYEALWKLIYGAMSQEDQEKFTGTFGQGVFVGYVVKDQADGIHLDGYANVVLPYYQVEITDTRDGTVLPVLGKNCAAEEAYTLSDVRQSVETYLTGIYGESVYQWSETGVAFSAGGRDYRVGLTAKSGTEIREDGSLQYQKLASAVEYYVAAFALAVEDITPSYTVTTSVVHGTITPSATVSRGGSQTVTYAPEPGYVLKSVSVDGQAVDAATYPKAYTFSSVTGNHTIEVVYQEQVVVPTEVQVGFYLQLEGKILDVAGKADDTTEQDWSRFTGAVYRATGAGLKAMVGESERDAAVIDFAIRSAYSEEGVLQGGFPSDRDVLEALLMMHYTDPELSLLTLAQREVNWNRLDTAHYRVQWYVVKDSGGQGWCVNGILADVTSGGNAGNTGGTIVEDSTQNDPVNPDVLPPMTEEELPVQENPGATQEPPVTEPVEQEGQWTEEIVQVREDALDPEPETGDPAISWALAMILSGGGLLVTLGVERIRRRVSR